MKGLLSLGAALAAFAYGVAVVDEHTNLHEAFRKAHADFAMCGVMIRTVPSWQTSKPRGPQDDASRPNVMGAQSFLELHRNGLTPCLLHSLEER